MKREEIRDSETSSLAGQNGKLTTAVIEVQPEAKGADSLYAQVQLDQEITDFINLADEHITIMVWRR